MMRRPAPNLSKDAIDVLIAAYKVNGDLFLLNPISGETPVVQNRGAGSQFFSLAGPRARYALDELLEAGLVRHADGPYHVVTVAGRDFAQALMGDNVAARSAVEHEIDKVTGIPLRAYVDSASKDLFEKCRTDQLPCGALVMDTDDFKSFNTRYGLAVGDKVLRAVAQTASQATRLRGGVIGRWGAGDEIVATMSNLTLPEVAAFGERIRASMETAPVDGMIVTVSIGVASGVGLSSVEELWDKAEKALRVAKERGKNQVARYQD